SIVAFNTLYENVKNKILQSFLGSVITAGGLIFIASLKPEFSPCFSNALAITSLATCVTILFRQILWISLSSTYGWTGIFNLRNGIPQISSSSQEMAWQPLVKKVCQTGLIGLATYLSTPRLFPTLDAKATTALVAFVSLIDNVFESIISH